MAKPNVTAFIYDKKGKLLSIGRNSYIKTHPLQASFAKAVGEDKRIYLHAEVHAITRLREEDSPYSIRVVRFDTNGKPALAKPCKICQFALAKIGIKEIEHT